MKIEYEISFVDALVIIDPERFKEMDEEFLYAFDIFLDKEGESELVCDFPGEDWKEVWDRETAVVQDFIEKSKMIVWRTEEGDYSSNIDKVNDLLEGGKESVQHAIGNANQAQSVLDGINPKYFNPESRFGGGFYVGADSDTIVAELAEHGNTAKYAISYDMNLGGNKVLDLTNVQVAEKWGYVQNLTSTKACQNIGTLAREQGYSVIKFQSYRGDGINYVIYNNFDNILSPRNVKPVN